MSTTSDNQLEGLKVPEGQENATDNSQKVEDLQGKCLALAEDLNAKTKTPENAAKCNKFLKDWLRTTEGKDPVELKKFLKSYPESVESDRRLVEDFDKKVDEAIRKGLLLAKSGPEYKNWIREQKTEDKRKFLGKSDLDDINRTKVVVEFDEFNKLFKSPDLKKRFDKEDLQKRQKTVAELKEKKKVIESGILPSFIRAKLFEKSATMNVDEAKKMHGEALKTHDTLKTRFIKLPPTVQMDETERFKKMEFKDRQKWLDGAEAKINGNVNQYRAKILKMQKPDANGLTLFSSTPEQTPGSSAKSYMDWFRNKLTLKGMDDALTKSDLEDPRRKQNCDEMAKQLKKTPKAKQAQTIGEFNASDLSRRIELIETHKTNSAESGIDDTKKNWLERTFVKIFTSREHEKAANDIETISAAMEIAKRRERYQQAHGVQPDMQKDAAKRGLTETMKKSNSVIGAVHSEKLHEKDGGLKVKIDTMETERGGRTELLGALSHDVDKTDATLAGNISLERRDGTVVNDAKAYRHDVLPQELKPIQEETAKILTDEAANSNVEITEQQIRGELKKTAFWEEMAKKAIRNRKTAA